jgi:hypothetical protein
MAPGSTEDPTARKEPSPKPLRLDVDRHVERLFHERANRGPLRFEETIEVVGRSPQAMLERSFRGLDLECGPAGVGAPTEAETRQFRPHPTPYLDFAALARLLKGRFEDGGAPRFFLYRVRNKEGVRYSLREDRVPDAWLYGLPGTSFELVETFTDADGAVRAVRRLERSLALRGPTVMAPPLPPWVTMNCRPSTH